MAVGWAGLLAFQLAPLKGGAWRHGGLIHQKSQGLTGVQ